MNRQEFLRGCATGLCACATACLPTNAFADPAKPDDWRLPFVKKRYAKLISLLSDRMSGEALANTLQDLGKFCAAVQDAETEKLRGQPEAYIKQATKNGLVVRYDAASRAYTSSFDPHGDCFCPLASEKEKTPGTVCECSRGWTSHTWSIVLDREVKVALKESVLRGGEVCKFEITAA